VESRHTIGAPQTAFTHRSLSKTPRASCTRFSRRRARRERPRRRPRPPRRRLARSPRARRRTSRSPRSRRASPRRSARNAEPREARAARGSVYLLVGFTAPTRKWLRVRRSVRTLSVNGFGTDSDVRTDPRRRSHCDSENLRRECWDRFAASRCPIVSPSPWDRVPLGQGERKRGVPAPRWTVAAKRA